MREPGFWWQKPGPVAWLLCPFALIYGAIAGWRMRRAGFRPGIPVICIGNFTLGGTGKTPAAIVIAKRLASWGETPFFLTRGYGGTLAGPVRVDPATHRASEVGDEPLLLARTAPTIVSRDRAAGAAFAQNAGASVIVMDDGLQNPSLHKDLSIALVDARRGLGNGCVFPAGPLRAPLPMQLAQVHAVVAVGAGPGISGIEALDAARDLPVLSARLKPAPGAAAAIGSRKALAFAGIGDPEKFFRTLDEAGIDATAKQSFADHHQYSEDEAASILARCQAEGLVPVTTEKDIARLSGQDGARGRLAAAARAVPVTLETDDPELLGELLQNALKTRRHRA
jgi:tetraacyldisaccharide 4'-kinase